MPELKPRRWYSSTEAAPQPGDRVHHAAITLHYCARVIPVDQHERPSAPPAVRIAPRRSIGRGLTDVA